MFDDILTGGYDENDSPPDFENINQFILYFGNEDFAELKQMCKDAMKTEFPVDFHERNASDIILLIMRKYHGKEINTEKKVDGTTGQ